VCIWAFQKNQIIIYCVVCEATAVREEWYLVKIVFVCIRSTTTRETFWNKTSFRFHRLITNNMYVDRSAVPHRIFDLRHECFSSMLDSNTNRATDLILHHAMKVKGGICAGITFNLRHGERKKHSE